MQGVGGNDGEICLLIAGMKAEHEPKSVGQRKFVIRGIAFVARWRTGIELAGEDRPVIGGHSKPDISGPCFDPAFEQAAQSPRSGKIPRRKSEIVHEQPEPAIDIP